MQTLNFDRSDLKILKALQKNARLSHVELSQLVHLSASQCQRRLKRLQETGVIKRYITLLDMEAVGLGVHAFVNVNLEKHGETPAKDFSYAIGHYPQILECWAVTGDADYMLRIVEKDLRSFSNFLLHELLSLPCVASLKSNILLEPIKETHTLPLE